MTDVLTLGGLNVSRETLERLRAYKTLLDKWNKNLNLVSRNTTNDIWNRHIIDCAACYPVCATHPGTWVDVGSGAGLPGLVLSILAMEENPSTSTICVESDNRKCEFIRAAARAVGSSNRTISERAENIDPLGANVILSRAMTDLTNLLSLADRHLSSHGRAVFMKGESWRDEVERAQYMWTFDLEAHPSWTNKDAAILEIGNIQRA